MEKIIKRTISLTTKKRDSRNKLFEEFYSHDKNTATFEFTVEGGVPTEDIVVLFHFKRTNRHLEVRGRVDNDKIIVNFDTSLIIKDEQVAGYIYYENGEKSNDVYRFMFDVHVSEIDKEHDLPVMEQESKRIVPLTDIVTKSEITELLKKIVANEKLYDDTEIKQKIELKADKETVQAISSKVEALENNSGNRTTYDDAEIRGQIATKADTQAVEAIAQRVQTLENKTDNDTVYNDTELRQAIEEKADKQALLQYSTKNELKEVSDKVQQLESRSQLDLSGLATKQEVEAIPKVNVDNLVTKDELSQKGYLTSHQSLENVVTKAELEQKGYLTAHQDISNLVTKEELHEATEIDYSQIVTHEELENKHYLTSHQSLAEYAKKTEIPNIDASSFVTKQELESKQYLTNHQSLDGYVKKSELPTPVDTSTLVSKQELTSMNLVNAEALGEVSKKILEQTTKITALESKSGYEIHGTGMPNGTVEAPIGTTYVDMAVTNGALKWIKQSGTGNTGWKVLIGDTGWRTLNSVSRLGNSFIKIRRVNNLITYQFGGLQWGWFGVGRRNGPGFARHNSSGDRGAKVLGTGGIPTGFRSEASLIGGIYNDAGKPYGIWYLGGVTDSNFIQFTFNDPIPTDKDIGDIRVSAISYLTNEDWPTTLP